MNKTFNINMSGRVFTIDDDAYALLKDYLDTLSHAFGNSDNEEIVSDIESRISEIFYLEQFEGKNIISLGDVEAVITRIGRPEEIIDSEIEVNVVEERDGEEEVVSEKSTTLPPPYNPTPAAPVKKRLFRDSSRGMIGGVCAGLAAYLNVDVTWIRLAMVALCFLSLSTIIIVYVILWLVLPDARTPIQQMQMNGEAPTLYNIGETVKNSFDRENGYLQFESREYNGTPDNAPSGFFGILTRILLFIVCVVLISIEVALGLGLIGCFIALMIFGSAAGWSIFNPSTFVNEEIGVVILGLLTAIGFIIFFGIPLFLLIRLILKGNNRQPMRKNNKIVLLVTWILGIVCAAICCGSLISLSNSEEFMNPINKIREVHFPNGMIIEESDEKETVIQIDTVINHGNGASMMISNGKDTVVNVVIKQPVKSKNASASETKEVVSLTTSSTISSDTISTEK